MKVSARTLTPAVAVLLTVAFISAGCASAPPLYLVKDGKATSTIVFPDGADSWTKEAAKWVMVYVAKSTGAHLKVVEESKAPEGTLVSVGHTQLAQKAGIRVDDLKWDGYRMVVKGNVLFLIGRDQNLVGGYGAKGTNRAAIAFVEEFCGVRFLLPTPEGELVPKAEDVCVPGELRKTFVAAFAYIDGRRPYRTGRAASFAHNTGTGGAIRAERGCSHTMPLFVPADKYFDEHPEYFALIGGKRRKGRHLCISNPDVQRIVLQKLREQFDAGYDWCILGQQDGYQACMCPRCESMDNYRAGSSVWEGPGGVEYVSDTLRRNPCERVLVPEKWIIDQCRKSHPDRTIQVIVYGPTLWPSRKFDKFGDTVIAEICDPLNTEVINAWRGKVRGLSAYIYWGDATGPMGMDVHVTPGELSKTIRFLRDKGFVGIRQWMGDGNWGLQGPLFYMLGKLVGDPDLDYQPLLEEYCYGVYGPKAGKTMIEFFNLLYARHEEILPPLAARGCRAPNIPAAEIFGEREHVRKFESLSEIYAAVYPPSFTQKLDRLLRKAEADAETDRAGGWLRLTRDHFDFSRFLGGMLTTYPKYEDEPTDKNLAELKAWVDKFEELRERIVNYDDEYVKRWFPRHASFCLYITSDGQGERIYYADWKKRKKEVLKKGLRGTAIGYRIGSFYRVIDEPIVLFKGSDKPVASSKRKEPLSLKVKRRPKPPKIDGIIEESEWKQAVPQSLCPLPPTKAKIGTRVRAAYDNRNLYVAWQCEEPQIDKLNLKEEGQDAPLWSVDCVELMLNPDARSNRRRFHFIVAPAPNSRYESQFENSAWNPKWQHAHRLDRKSKSWSVEMAVPFKELGLAAPKSNATWSANFGRERYAGEPAATAEPPPGFLPKKEAEIFVWSPPKGGGFSNLTGRLRFE